MRPKIRCYLIDDEPLHFKTLESYISKFEDFIIVGKETEANIALDYLNQQDDIADLIFLDIDMPGINGVELAQIIGDSYKIIFTTAHRNYGAEAFELNAVDYLIKPIRFSRFTDAIEKAKKALENDPKSSINPDEGPDSIFIQGDGRGSWLKVKLSEIIYIKSDSNYMHFVLTTHKKVSYGSLEKIYIELPPSRFIRVHRSYIVNIEHIVKGDTFSITMSDKSTVPIGRIYKLSVLEKLKR